MKDLLLIKNEVTKHDHVMCSRLAAQPCPTLQLHGP